MLQPLHGNMLHVFIPDSKVISFTAHAWVPKPGKPQLYETKTPSKTRKSSTVVVPVIKT